MLSYLASYRLHLEGNISVPYYQHVRRKCPSSAGLVPNDEQTLWILQFFKLTIFANYFHYHLLFLLWCCWWCYKDLLRIQWFLWGCLGQSYLVRCWFSRTGCQPTVLPDILHGRSVPWQHRPCSAVCDGTWQLSFSLQACLFSSTFRVRLRDPHDTVSLSSYTTSCRPTFLLLSHLKRDLRWGHLYSPQ